MYTSFLQIYDVNFSGSGLQIREALQLQLDVQRQLHEQLEVNTCNSFRWCQRYMISVYSRAFNFLVITSCTLLYSHCKLAYK